MLAGSLDVIDIIGDLTIVGMIASYALKIVSFPILYMYGANSSGRTDAMNNIASALEQRVSHVKKKTYTYASRTRTTAKVVRKLSKSNGRLFSLASNVLDFIPWIDAIPWRTLGVVLTYRDERRTYNETKPAIKEYIAVFAESQQQEIAEMADEA